MPEMVSGFQMRVGLQRDYSKLNAPSDFIPVEVCQSSDDTNITV